MRLAAEERRGRSFCAPRRPVIPAQAGIQLFRRCALDLRWTPACAGVTGEDPTVLRAHGFALGSVTICVISRGCTLTLATSSNMPR